MIEYTHSRNLHLFNFEKGVKNNKKKKGRYYEETH